MTLCFSPRWTTSVWLHWLDIMIAPAPRRWQRERFLFFNFFSPLWRKKKFKAAMHHLICIIPTSLPPIHPLWWWVIFSLFLSLSISPVLYRKTLANGSKHRWVVACLVSVFLLIVPSMLEQSVWDSFGNHRYLVSLKEIWEPKRFGLGMYLWF